MEGADSLLILLQRFSLALQDAPVSLFNQDRSLRYVWVHNPFPGLVEEDILGKTDAEFLIMEEARMIEEIKRSVLEQRRKRRVKVRMTLNNQQAFFDLVLQPWFDQDGELHGISGAAVEITDLLSAVDASAIERLAGDETLPFSLDSESRARLLASLSRSFAETGNDFPAILDTITHLVADVAGDACVIRLTGDEGHQGGHLAAFYVNPPSEMLSRSLMKQVSETFLPLLENGMMLDGKALVIPDFMARPELVFKLSETLAGWLKDFPIHALMVLPLRTTRRMLGTFTIWRSRQAKPYSFEEQAFWQDVADRAALAIENARLYAEEVHRNRQLNALHDATTALLSTLDLEVLLGRILDAAQQAIPAAEQGVLYLVAPRTGRLEVRAMSGFGDPRIRRVGMLHNSHANRSIRERRPILVRNTPQENLAEPQSGQQPAGSGTLAVPSGTLAPPSSTSAPPTETGSDAFVSNPLVVEEQNNNSDGTERRTVRSTDPETFRSAILAPLVLGDEVLGTLSLSSSRPYAFDHSDLQLLVSFAATTTAAMHNAMLHTELQRIAITDPLTGLYNRRGLIELGRHEVERFQRFGQPLSAIMLDIDHFKTVNDTYGHSVGDQVLCGLAERCRALVRQIDILGRYGGEEFAILLPETDLFQASAIAERLRRAVEESPFFTEQGPIVTTISLGVSRAGRNLTSLVTLIEQADLALYQAKQKGRNRVELG